MKSDATRLAAVETLYGLAPFRGVDPRKMRGYERPDATRGGHVHVGR